MNKIISFRLLVPALSLAILVHNLNRWLSDDWLMRQNNQQKIFIIPAV